MAGEARRAAARRAPRAALLALLTAATLLLAACGGGSGTPAGDAKGNAPAPAASDTTVAQGGAAPAGGAAGAPAPETARQVRAVSPTQGTLTTQRSTSVTIDPGKEAQVAAGASGRVRSVRQREGAQVKAGEVVVQLDDANARLQLDNARIALESARVNLSKAQKASGEGTTQAQAALDTAKANLDIAQTQADTGRQLFDAGGISQTDLKGLEAQLAQAQAAYQQAQDAVARSQRSGTEDLELLRLQVQQASNQVDQAQRAVDEASIEAPFAGEIADLAVEEGEFVAAGSRVFRLVADEGQLAHFQVPPTDAQRLTQQGIVYVRYGGLDYAAQITRTSEVPGASRLVALTASLYPSQHHIPTGTVAQLQYEIPLANGSLLPASAVQTTNGTTTVLIVDAASGTPTAVRTPVEVLGEAGGQAAVAGLPDGARVIYPVPADLRAGTPVQVVPGETTP